MFWLIIVFVFVFVLVLALVLVLVLALVLIFVLLLTFVLVFVLLFLLLFPLVLVLLFPLVLVLLFPLVPVLLFPLVPVLLFPLVPVLFVFVPGFGFTVKFPRTGFLMPGGSLIILTGGLVLFVGFPLFCTAGTNCVNPGRVLVVSWFGGVVLFCPPPGAKLTKPGSVFVVVLFCPAPPGGCRLFSAGFDNDSAGFDNDNAGFDNDNAVLLLLLLDEVWFDGVEAFPFELWWDVFAYAAGALLSTDPIKKSVITAVVSIIVCSFILIIFLNLKLNNSSIEVTTVNRYKSSGRYIRKRRPG